MCWLKNTQTANLLFLPNCENKAAFNFFVLLKEQFVYKKAEEQNVFVLQLNFTVQEYKVIDQYY